MIRDLSVACKSLSGRLACPNVMQPPGRRWIVKPVLLVGEPQAKLAARVLWREMENHLNEHAGRASDSDGLGAIRSELGIKHAVCSLLNAGGDLCHTLCSVWLSWPLSPKNDTYISYKTSDDLIKGWKVLLHWVKYSVEFHQRKNDNSK